MSKQEEKVTFDRPNRKRCSDAVESKSTAFVHGDLVQKQVKHEVRASLESVLPYQIADMVSDMVSQPLDHAIRYFCTDGSQIEDGSKEPTWEALSSPWFALAAKPLVQACNYTLGEFLRNLSMWAAEGVHLHVDRVWHLVKQCYGFNGLTFADVFEKHPSLFKPDELYDLQLSFFHSNVREGSTCSIRLNLLSEETIFAEVERSVLERTAPYQRDGHPWRAVRFLRRETAATRFRQLWTTHECIRIALSADFRTRDSFCSEFGVPLSECPPFIIDTLFSNGWEEDKSHEKDYEKVERYLIKRCASAKTVDWSCMNWFEERHIPTLLQELYTRFECIRTQLLLDFPTKKRFQERFSYLHNHDLCPLFIPDAPEGPSPMMTNDPQSDVAPSLAGTGQGPSGT